jgi:hypothetical protein
MRGVEESEVLAVCDRLFAAGDEPSVRRVHLEIGRGSYTTIARHLRVWRSAQARAAATPSSEHPQVQALALLAPDAWAQAIALARQDVADTLARITAERDAAQRDLASAETSIAGIEERAATAEAELTGRLASAIAERDAERRRADAIEAGFAMFSSRVEAMAGRIAELSEAHRAATAAAAAAAARIEASTSDAAHHAAEQRREQQAATEEMERRLARWIDAADAASVRGLSDLEQRLVREWSALSERLVAAYGRNQLSAADRDQLLRAIATGDRRRAAAVLRRR